MNDRIPEDLEFYVDYEVLERVFASWGVGMPPLASKNCRCSVVIHSGWNEYFIDDDEAETSWDIYINVPGGIYTVSHKGYGEGCFWTDDEEYEIEKRSWD